MNHKKNIIIIGTGEIGTSIAGRLLLEGHDVSVIEKNKHKLENLANNFDVKTVHGNGCLPKSLKAAGAENADILIALSSIDEVNMVACQVAYSIFNVKLRMARIYNQNYLDDDYQNLFNDEDLPVDYIVSPEQHVADRIGQILDLPKAQDVVYFNNRKEVLFSLKLTKEFKFLGSTLEQFNDKISYEFATMVISRNSKLFTPSVENKFCEHDIVFFLMNRKYVKEFISFVGLVSSDSKDILIIGGGNTGFGVAKSLEGRNKNVKILDRDAARTRFLAERLNEATVINSEALDFKALDDANLANMDIVLNLTNSDETNALCSIYANQNGLDNIITLVKNNYIGSLALSMEFAKIITPRNITASQVAKFVRSTKIYNLCNILNNSAEVAEIKITKHSVLSGITIENFNKEYKHMQIGAVVNIKGTFYDKDYMLHHDDRIIVLVKKEALEHFYDLIEKG